MPARFDTGIDTKLTAEVVEHYKRQTRQLILLIPLSAAAIRTAGSGTTDNGGVAEGMELQKLAKRVWV